MAQKPTFNSASLPPEASFFDRIQSGDVGAVKNMLRNRGQAAVGWQKTQTGQSGLHIAAQHNQRRIAAELVKAGAHIEARDHLRRTPLLQAARSGHQNMVAFLLQEKADMTATDKNGNTALHLAAEGISADTVLFLLAQGADVTSRNQAGATAIDIALSQGNQAMAAIIRNGQPPPDHTAPTAANDNVAIQPTPTNAISTARDITVRKPLNLRLPPKH